MHFNPRISDVQANHNQTWYKGGEGVDGIPLWVFVELRYFENVLTFV